MDLIQIISYRLIHFVLSLLSFLGLAGGRPFPLFSYDTSEYARENEGQAGLFRGTYRQVLDELKKNKEKMLLLFFHSPQQPESKLVKRQIFGDAAFSSFLEDAPELMIFPVSIESFSGWQLAYQFYCMEVPSFTLVRHGDSGELQVVGRCNGVVDVQSVLFLLRDNSSSTNPKQLDITQSEEADDELGNSTSSSSFLPSSNSAILAQQQSDYEASLAKDRAKERDRLEKEAELERQAMHMKTAKQERMALISKAQDILEDEQPDANVKLAVQLPDGRKIQRRFSSEVECSQVYAFVDINYLEYDDALIDYRLQSLHPPAHLSRSSKLSQYFQEGPHKILVDLTPVGLSRSEEEDGGNESDAED